MATLEHLATIGKLKKHEPELEQNEFPDRHFYMAPGVDAWASSILANAAHVRGRDLSPLEQVEQLVHDFVVGRPINYFQRRKFDLPILHVWELKTPDVRLLGWFPRKKHFVMVCGEMKANLLSARLYKPYIAGVVAFRDNLDLDEPKSLTEGVYSDVF